ncbi:MAG: CBS domain-containing protein [Oscillospiraceae bacterium]|nr:CBS domain-containing protein [Oscillospiraceae bacterium]
MNILFFLTPKIDVAFIYDDFTLRQTLEKMEHHRYSSIPVLNRKGEYIGTITEGDLLWSIKNDYNLNLKEAENVSVTNISRRKDNKPVGVNTKIEDLMSVASVQNFVPVIDDKNSFIGIVKRRDIIQYCCNRLKELL